VKALFDSNILIDYLNGFPQAKKEIERYSNKLISTITWMEVLVGVSKDDELVVRRFLSQFQQISVTPEVSEKAVDIRRESLRKSGIRLPDAIIQASAETENALLITRNTKDFSEDNPAVRIPYKIIESH
jgi:predicted nucleic acid-binding protein